MSRPDPQSIAAARRAPPGEVGLEVLELQAPGIGPISFALGRGRRVGLHGPSGAGKSRLLRALADLDRHEGEVYLDGVSQTSIAPTEWRRTVALLPAQTHWWAERAVDHFSVPADAEWLEELGLSASLLQRPVSELSSGEAQRLALLRVLANRPRVLLLDEPTANLDADNAARVESFVAGYSTEREASVLWVGHDVDQLERVCEELMRIEGGRLMDRRRTRS